MHDFNNFKKISSFNGDAQLLKQLGEQKWKVHYSKFSSTANQCCISVDTGLYYKFYEI